MWQVFDWYLRCNAGYYGMRSACRPLHVQHAPDDQTLHVVSTRAVPLAGLRVHLKVTDLAGRIEFEKILPADVGADETRLIGHVPALVRDGRLHFVSLRLLEASNNCLEESVTWHQNEDALSDLLLLSPATVAARIGSVEKVDGEWKAEFEIAHAAGAPAAFISLRLFASGPGREILPVFWTENAFTLLPGAKKSVSARFRAASTADVHLRVQGWNVEPLEVSLDSTIRPSRRLTIEKVTMTREGDEPQIMALFRAESDSDGGILTHPAALFRDGKLIRNFRVESNGARVSQSRLRLGPEEAAGRLEIQAGHSRVAVR
jgi:hypothetical protein